MKEIATNPTTAKQAGVKVIDMSARIRAILGEVQARASSDQLTGTNLDTAVECTANALVKTCTVLTNRFDQYTEVLTQATKVLEEQDANAAQHFHEARIDRYGHTIR